MEHMATTTRTFNNKEEAKIKDQFTTAHYRLMEAIRQLQNLSTDKETKRWEAYSAMRAIKETADYLEQLGKLVTERLLDAGATTVRQAAEAQGTSTSTIVRRSRDEVQAPQLTTGQHLSDTDLARLVASFYGWSIDAGVRFFDNEDKPIGNDMAQAAAAMRELGWFYNPAVPSVGVRWAIMPGPHDGMIAANKIRPLLKDGQQYWAYDSTNHPWFRARDGKPYEEVMEEFKQWKED